MLSYLFLLDTLVELVILAHFTELNSNLKLQGCTLNSFNPNLHTTIPLKSVIEFHKNNSFLLKYHENVVFIIKLAFSQQG